MSEVPVYGSLREKIAAEKVEKVLRQEGYVRDLAEAWNAGREAAEGLIVTPMVVQEHASSGRALLTPLDPGPVARSYFVADGVCGFASVELRINKSASKADQSEGRRFLNWLTGNQKPSRPDLAPTLNPRKGYYGGVTISVSEYNQSLQRKEAHAMAAAKVLAPRYPGLFCRCDSRMD